MEFGSFGLEGIQHVEAIEYQSSCQDAFASSLKQWVLQHFQQQLTSM